MLTTESEDVSEETICRAADLLRQGELVSFPTETVYGLGADATNRDALRKLYQAKGRPASHPVIVHVDSVAAVHDWAVAVPDTFFLLAEKFWPGPLTVVLQRAPDVLDELTGGQDTVAVRMPDHPLALRLLRSFGSGLAAPSANKFGRLSPTLAQHVRDEFGDEISMVLDGGACQVGIESTIVDLSGGPPRILRPGMVNEQEIFATLGNAGRLADGSERPAINVGMVATNTVPGEVQVTRAQTADAEKDVRVPGSLASHYAPSTPMHLISTDALQSFLAARKEEKLVVTVISFRPPAADFSASDWITLPQDPHQFARLIYSSLRKLDRRKANLIVVESPPALDLRWHGIEDRLKRAAHRE